MSSNFKLLSDQFDDANGYIRMRVTPKGSYTFENVSSYTLEFFWDRIGYIECCSPKGFKK